MLLLWVGSCQVIKPESISTAVTSPIELVKIINYPSIINEKFELDIVKESSVGRFQHSEPSWIL